MTVRKENCMERYRAPYGNGYYEIGKINGKWIGVIYDYDGDDGYQMVEDNRDELCDRIADYYF